MCRCVQHTDLLNAVQGELSQVGIVVSGTDQITDRMAGNQASRVYTERVDPSLAPTQVLDLQLLAVKQGRRDLLPNLRSQLCR
ncbi:hypothetical protein D9M69_616150 [compost metagenome]